MSRTEHLTEAELAAVAHGEAHGERPERRRAVDAHLAQCDACRAAVDALRGDDAATARLLLLVDHPPPADAFERMLAAGRRRPQHVRRPRFGRIAAAGVITAAIAAAAAAALPHSPLRRLLAPATPPAAARPSLARAPTPAHTPPTRDADRAGAGIALVPGQRLEIQFLRPGSGHLVVRLSDAPQVALHPTNGAAAFSVRAGRIVVDDTTGRASFELVVPRGLGHLHVRVDTALVFEKDAARIVTRARPGDAADTYTLDLVVAGGPGSPRAAHP